ncbi:MAG: hypothetical protein NT007_09980 [Candidatus Kapabacteria bacterium]|nr:hypothetical protein [Candidatus Kapabacteria bacterium]
MKIEFLSKFRKDLESIDDVRLHHKLLIIIREIESANKLSDITNVKKLVGFKNAYRIKIGEYRIGFYCENGIIELARLVHRKDIYKKFP